MSGTGSCIFKDHQHAMSAPLMHGSGAEIR